MVEQGGHHLIVIVIVIPRSTFLDGAHWVNSGAYCLGLLVGGHVVDGVGVDVDHADQDGGQLPNHLLLLPPLVTPGERYVEIEQFRMSSANSEFGATIWRVTWQSS